MKKRILFLFTLAFALCACCLFASAKTFETRTVDHVVYIFYPATEELPERCSVMSLFDSEEAMQGVTELTIPAEIDGVPVTSIFKDTRLSYIDAELETVHLPDTLQSISLDAFQHMRSLQEIEIPSSVTAIGQRAFLGCTGLTEITLPDGLVGLGKGCFKDCKNLAQVQYTGDKLEKIGDYAFARCGKLQTFAMPASLQSIGRYAFYRTGVKSVRIPGGCCLNALAFSYATKLKKVVFEDRTGKDAYLIGLSAFSGCSNLLKVYFPKETAPFQIPANAFAGCKKLQAVYRTSQVTAIGASAFYGCESLRSFTVPEGITAIGTYAFENCTGLKKLRVLATSTAFLTAKKQNAAFLKTLPEGCKVYVKTAAMQRAFVSAGCTNKVIVKADLK